MMIPALLHPGAPAESHRRRRHDTLVLLESEQSANSGVSGIPKRLFAALRRICVPREAGRRRAPRSCDRRLRESSSRRGVPRRSARIPARVVLPDPDGPTIEMRAPTPTGAMVRPRSGRGHVEGRPASMPAARTRRLEPSHRSPDSSRVAGLDPHTHASNPAARTSILAVGGCYRASVADRSRGSTSSVATSSPIPPTKSCASPRPAYASAPSRSGFGSDAASPR